jgi:twitching motility protein PilT
VIEEGEFYGMQTFDQALLAHYQANRVSMEDALRVATSPHDFKLLVAAEGRTSTSMADIVDPSEQKRSASPGTLKRPAGPPARPTPSAPAPNGSSPPPGVAA